jgi:hypothetical protein
MKRSSLLCVILPPSAVVPVAISLQCHQPDHVVFLRTFFDSKDIQESLTPEQKRLFAWLEGGESLLACFDDLNVPFQLEYTPPSGYIPPPGGSTPKTETRYVSIEELRKNLDDIAQQYQHCDLIVDFFPGGKNAKMDLLFLDGTWKKWYSSEAGVAVSFCQKQGEAVTKQGKHVSIVDRAWLGGNPVKIERTVVGKTTEKEWSFYSRIIETLEYESDKFDAPKVMNQEEYCTKLRIQGYEVELLKPTAGSKETFLQIKKDEFRININLLDHQGKRTGFYLEPLVNAILTHSEWEPIECVFGMEVYESSPELRMNKLASQVDHLFRSWVEHQRGGNNPAKARTFEEICEEMNISPHQEMKLGDLKNALKGPLSKKLQQMLLVYIQVCEIDALLLDKTGLVLFDAKATFHSYERSTFSTKRPGWLNQREEYAVIPARFCPKSFERSNIIHFERLHKGRRVFEDPERCYPLNSAELRLAKTFEFVDGVCEAHPDITIVNEYSYGKNNPDKPYAFTPQIHIPDVAKLKFFDYCIKNGHLFCEPSEQYDVRYTGAKETIYIENSNEVLKLSLITSTKEAAGIGSEKPTIFVSYDGFFTQARWNTILELIRNDVKNCEKVPKSFRENIAKKPAFLHLSETVSHDGQDIIQFNTKYAKTHEKESLIASLAEEIEAMGKPDWHTMVGNLKTMVTPSQWKRLFGRKGPNPNNFRKQFGDRFRIVVQRKEQEEE